MSLYIYTYLSYIYTLTGCLFLKNYIEGTYYFLYTFTSQILSEKLMVSVLKNLQKIK